MHSLATETVLPSQLLWLSRMHQMKADAIYLVHILGRKSCDVWFSTDGHQWIECQPEREINFHSGLWYKATQKPIKLLADVEKQHILSTLLRCYGNKAKAAKTLGIERSTLDRKLKQWKITPAEIRLMKPSKPSQPAKESNETNAKTNASQDDREAPTSDTERSRSSSPSASKNCDYED